ASHNGAERGVGTSGATRRCAMARLGRRPGPVAASRAGSGLPATTGWPQRAGRAGRWARLRLCAQLALQMPRQLGNSREVEQLRQVDQPGILVINPLMDLDQLERAGPDLEEVVIDADALTLQRGIADGLQLILDCAE